MQTLVPGDTVVVSKLDRLARSSRDLHNIQHELQERGCGFVSLGDVVRQKSTVILSQSLGPDRRDPISRLN